MVWEVWEEGGVWEVWGYLFPLSSYPLILSPPSFLHNDPKYFLNYVEPIDKLHLHIDIRTYE